jgi:hypothetical protein
VPFELGGSRIRKRFAVYLVFVISNRVYGTVQCIILLAPPFKQAPVVILYSGVLCSPVIRGTSLWRRPGNVAVPKSITIYLVPEDPDLKRLIGDLKRSSIEDNPYQGRSESEIARMLLTREVKREHQRLCRSETGSSATSVSNNGTKSRRRTR